MDDRLIPADPSLVRRALAKTYLSAPVVNASLGSVRLLPHQVDAAARLLSILHEWNGALLADATGLGKTYVAIAVARLIAPALVVAPAALRSMWHRSLGAAGVTADVVTYEVLSRNGAGSLSPPGLLILDEAHHARNPRSRRYAALAELAWGARVLLLSATPVHNRLRDLRALIALFTGSRAYTMDECELRSLLLRRTSADTASNRWQLPRIERPRWLDIHGDSRILEAISTLPPSVPVAGGSQADALNQLGLIRAWCSSEYALRETLRRRLRRVAVFTASLESGQFPDRRTLAAWPTVGDAVQLGFPDLFEFRRLLDDATRVLDHLAAHASGVRAILRALDENEGRSDRARIDLLRSIRNRHAPTPVVAFSQFADTTRAVFRHCVADGGIALVTGGGARVASGPMPIDEIVRRFDQPELETRASRAVPLNMLIASDVLSEGFSLRRAGVLVHLDLPWTVARLEQRVGRLRRFGSRFETLVMYALGPPVGARELMRVIRALQRKARVSSGIVGTSELSAAVPLLGARMDAAIAGSALRHSRDSGELLRVLMSQWAQGNADRLAEAAHPVAVALVDLGGSFRLVAAVGSRIVDRFDEVLAAAETLTGVAGITDMSAPTPLMELLEGWVDRQRGRQLAELVAATPSAAHCETLRRVQEILNSASRAERTSLAERVARCRDLVNRAVGAGAEASLQELLDGVGKFSLDVLERRLESRVASRKRQSVRLLAVVARNESGNGMVAFWHPDLEAISRDGSQRVQGDGGDSDAIRQSSVDSQSTE